MGTEGLNNFLRVSTLHAHSAEQRSSVVRKVVGLGIVESAAYCRSRLQLYTPSQLLWR